MKVNCMRLRPNWMYEDRHIIGDMPLHSLMIPGTHNAGAYDANVGVSDWFYLHMNKRKSKFELSESIISGKLYV